MSEFVVCDDDPDPLPADEIPYAINYQTGLAYEGYDLSREYAELQEKDAVARLSVAVDRVLQRYKQQDDGDNCYVKTDQYTLRRRMIAHAVEGRVVKKAAYWFVDRTDGETDYCRSWSVDSPEVNWCHNEELHEPAADVMERITQAFPLTERPVPTRRSFGAATLSMLNKLHWTRVRGDTPQ